MKYTINSTPYSVVFDCPHCGERVEIKVNKLDFEVFDGGIAECPECHKEVNLDEWEYD